MITFENIVWVIDGDLIVGYANAPGDRQMALGADMVQLDLTEDETKQHIVDMFRTQMAA